MKIINRKQMEELIEQNPWGGVVFAEYTPCEFKSQLMVTDGDFGATMAIPQDGHVFDFDWNIKEYADSDLFAVLDNNDILQIIQTLTRFMSVELSFPNEFLIL
ncbi:MAG: hypothetical protein II388_09110 [Clostridia bacterium]|nr:hypothetical protein [Clostridia bacterium]